MRATFKIAMTLALGLALPVSSEALSFSPGSPGVTATNCSGNPTDEMACIEAAFPGVDLTSFLYKKEAGGAEEGLLKDSYNTTFSSGNENATITYVSGTAATCPTCFLFIKDGQGNPTAYMVNLGNWNGIEDIVLTGFWANTAGEISHIDIFSGTGGGGSPGSPGAVAPEPASLLLLGTGLAVVAARIRNRNRKRA